MMICYLIRHGKDDTSVRGGWSNSPLSSEGIAQAEQLASTILQADKQDIAAIYTSDLPRARQTAEILSSALSVPVIELPEFREADNGVLAGMDNQAALEQFPGLYWNALEWEQPYPGGESPCQFFSRIAAAWHNLKAKLRNMNHNAALVTHGGVLNVIRCIESGVQYSNKTNPFPAGYAEQIGIEI